MLPAYNPESMRTEPRKPQPQPPAAARIATEPARLSWQYAVTIAAAQMAVFLFYVLTELHQNGKLGFPLDDPWIHLTFARNLARGWGFAFNQGEPVQGSSAPLWTLVLAFFHLFTKSAAAMVWIAKILGAVFLYVAALFAARIAMAITRLRWAGLACGLAVATLSHFGWAMVSGMEVTLSVALTLAGAYYHVVSRRDWRQYLPWILFALAVYVRPEAFLLVGFLVVDILVRRWAFRYKMMLGRGLAAFALVVAPYLVLNLALTHSIFPQTYVAKVGRTSMFAALASRTWAQVEFLLFRMPTYYLGGFVTHFWQANPVLMLLGIVGLVVLVVQFISRKGSASLLIPLVVCLYAPFLGMTSPFVSPAFQTGRYLGSPLALAVVLSIAGAAYLLSRIRRRTVMLAVAGALALLTLSNMAVTGIATAGNVAKAESSINRIQVALGEWLEENTAPDAVIACNDVGAIGYFANRKILDLLGLVTPEVMKYRKKYQVGQENFAGREFVFARKPDYLVIIPSWFPNLEKADFLVPVHGVDLADNYASQWDFHPRVRTVLGILVTGLELDPIRSTMVVYQPDWSKAH